MIISNDRALVVYLDFFLNYGPPRGQLVYIHVTIALLFESEDIVENVVHDDNEDGNLLEILTSDFRPNYSLSSFRDKDKDASQYLFQFCRSNS